MNIDNFYLHENQPGDSFNVELITGATASKSGEVFRKTRTAHSRTGKKHIKKLLHGVDSPPHMTSWIEPYRLHCSNINHFTFNSVHVSYCEDFLKARRNTHHHRAAQVQKAKLCSSNTHAVTGTD